MGKVIIWHDWKHRVPNFTIGDETTHRSGDWCKIWVKELDDEITIEWPFYFRLSSFGYLLLTYIILRKYGMENRRNKASKR